MRTFTFEAQASLYVRVTADSEEEAREAYERIGGEMGESFGFTTAAGHHLDTLVLDAGPDLYMVDDEEVTEVCPEDGCTGFVVNETCTSRDCPARARDVYCKFCRNPMNKGTFYYHDGGFVCEGCWDDRLWATA